MVCFTLNLAVFYIYLQYAKGASYFMEKDNFTYSVNDILEEKTAESVLQCARRCSYFNECVAVELQEETSTCVVLKYVTETSEETDTQQYRVKQVCAAGWIEFSDSCYLLKNVRLRSNWTDCVNKCGTYGAYLVTVTSQEESDFINSLRGRKSTWLGARNLLDENETTQWIWANGEKFEYTNWHTNEPTDDINLCARTYLEQQDWRSKTCDYELHCLCEYTLA